MSDEGLLINLNCWNFFPQNSLTMTTTTGRLCAESCQGTMLTDYGTVQSRVTSEKGLRKAEVAPKSPNRMEMLI